MKEVPQHHMPQTQGLELLTHPAVSDAYVLFWKEVSKMADCVKHRHAARQEAVLDTVSNDAEEPRQEAA